MPQRLIHKIDSHIIPEPKMFIEQPHPELLYARRHLITKLSHHHLLIFNDNAYLRIPLSVQATIIDVGAPYD